MGSVELSACTSQAQLHIAQLGMNIKLMAFLAAIAGVSCYNHNRPRSGRSARGQGYNDGSHGPSSGSGYNNGQHGSNGNGYNSGSNGNGYNSGSNGNGYNSGSNGNGYNSGSNGN